MPDQDTSRKTRKPAARREFEVAYFTKELGRPLQRQMLARQLAGPNDIETLGSHGEDAPQADSAPPREDRAG